MTEKKTIRWGIIGCGNVTEVKSGPALQKADNSELVAVMRRTAEKARDYAERHNVAKWYDNAEKLIFDPDVDAVYIATPPSTHMEYTIKTAQAGKPVYVEKPMARCYDECQKMILACRDASVPLFVAYYRRALPRYLKVKELIEAKKIGTIRAVTIRLYEPPAKADYNRDNLPWRVIPEIAGAGKFLDLASHTLDILDFILGPVFSVKGMAGNQANLYPAEDWVNANFIFKSGVHGTGLWNFSGFKSTDINEIMGEEGVITFSTFGNEPVKLETKHGISEFPITNPVHIQQPLIQTIVNNLNRAGECPSRGESGARTSLIMDKILSDWRKSQGIKFD